MERTKKKLSIRSLAMERTKKNECICSSTMKRTKKNEGIRSSTIDVLTLLLGRQFSCSQGPIVDVLFHLRRVALVQCVPLTSHSFTLVH